jgi:hypothetical protein
VRGDLRHHADPADPALRGTQHLRRWRARRERSAGNARSSIGFALRRARHRLRARAAEAAVGTGASDAIVACDVGQHQMWVAQHWRIHHPRKHLTSGALGTMGFGLPAAMGAQFACPDRARDLVSGDGFMMNIQELATLSRYNLPVKIVLLDNRRWAWSGSGRNCSSTERYSEIDLSDNPDFAALAACVRHRPPCTSNAREDVDAACRPAGPKGPALLHVAIDTAANVWPLVPPNRNNAECWTSRPPIRRCLRRAHPTPRRSCPCATSLTSPCVAPRARWCACWAPPSAEASSPTRPWRRLDGDGDQWQLRMVIDSCTRAPETLRAATAENLRRAMRNCPSAPPTVAGTEPWDRRHQDRAA